MNDKQIQPDSEVTIHFSLALADGTPVDGTADGEPITFTLGEGYMLTVFEEALIGLKKGDSQQISLDPRDTYGFPDEENKHWIEKEKFDSDAELEPGLMLEFSTPAGDAIPGIVEDIAEDKVLIDFNHPLAGQEVIFSVHIVDIT